MKQVFSLIFFSVYLSILWADELNHKNSPKASELFLQAETAFQSNQWETSLSLFNQVIEINPESVAAWVGMGLSLNHLGLYRRAIEPIQQAARLEPNDATIHAMLAQTYLKNRQYVQADTWYQKAIKMHLENAPVSWYLDLGFIETQLGNLEKARRYYLVAVQLYPRSVAAYQNLGILLLNQNRLDEADACFYTVLSIQKDIGAALFGQGEVAFKRTDYTQAIVFYRQAIEREPKVPQYHRAMGQTLLRLGKALEGYQYLAKSKRLRAEQFRHEAHRSARQKDWPQVISKLKLAMERDPTYLSALEDLAYVYAQQERLSLAESVLSNGLMRVKDWAPGYWQRGEVRFRLRNYDLAEIDLRKAIELAPSAAPPKFALARLLLEQRKSLIEALELAETVNRLTPKPEHYQLWLDVKNYID